jgi:hypothetical protein
VKLPELVKNDVTINNPRRAAPDYPLNWNLGFAEVTVLFKIGLYPSMSLGSFVIATPSINTRLVYSYTRVKPSNYSSSYDLAGCWLGLDSRNEEGF